nr:MAG TPA: hypothetical protein [Caudoviricetes sp.]
MFLKPSKKTKICTTTFDERGDMLYLVQNIYVG